MADPVLTLVSIARANEGLRLALLEEDRRRVACERAANVAIVWSTRAKRTRTKVHRAEKRTALERAQLAREQLAKARLRLNAARVRLDRLLRRVGSPLAN